MKYLIWCKERNMWWNPNRRGYTCDIFYAGRYTKEETLEILEEANVAGLNEYCLLAPEYNQLIEGK